MLATQGFTKEPGGGQKENNQENSEKEAHGEEKGCEEESNFKKEGGKEKSCKEENSEKSNQKEGFKKSGEYLFD